MSGFLMSGSRGNGTPVDVSYVSLDLTTLTQEQIRAIGSGRMHVTVSLDATGGDTLIYSTGSKRVALTIGPGSGRGTALNVTREVARALARGEPYFVIGVCETSGTTAALSNVPPDGTCFAAGTRLRTPAGEQAVECLRPGDLVLTGVDATPRPITWIGERMIDLRAHPRPELAAPIRIAAGAFDDGVPARDLLLSPDHGVFVDGRLVPARRLVNGTTVTQCPDLAPVQYFQVEMDCHTLLRAEGLLAESSPDAGHRAGTRHGACAKLASTDEARIVWQRLALRATGCGWDLPPLPETTQDGEPGLQAAGRTVPPVVSGRRLIFALPRQDGGVVHLTSRATAPATLRPWEEDRRPLGLCVHALILHGSHGARRIALDDPALGDGWWDIEAGAHGTQRWTDGAAVIALPDGEPADVLEVVLADQASHTRLPGARVAA